MLFSVIIPTCNRNEMLELCLQRLAPGSQTMDASQYEVIVSDDGKNNEARDLVLNNYAWVKWTEGGKKGPAANRNNGAGLARGEWLVFTDDDCLPDSNLLKAYAEAIKATPGVHAFEGSILPDNWELLKKDMAECPVNTKGGAFWSANIMLEKGLFRRIGGFDERYTIAAQEDQDLQIASRKYSAICFVEKAIVHHPVRIVQLSTMLQQADARVCNFLYYAIKNSNELGYKSKRDILWKSGVKTQLASFLHNLKKGKYKSAYLSSRYFFNYLGKLFVVK